MTVRTHYDIEIINGLPYTRPGVCMLSGVRCPHGVVDGDKPLTAAGPRCKTCLATWQPISRPSDHYKNQMDYFCNECGEELHTVYSSRSGKTKARFLAHDTPIGCSITDYPIPGNEHEYNFYGFGKFEQHLERLWSNAQYMARWGKTY